MNDQPQASNQTEWDSSIPDTHEEWPWVAFTWNPATLRTELRPTMKWVLKGAVTSAYSAAKGEAA